MIISEGQGMSQTFWGSMTDAIRNLFTGGTTTTPVEVTKPAPIVRPIEVTKPAPTLRYEVVKPAPTDVIRQKASSIMYRLNYMKRIIDSEIADIKTLM